MTSPAETTLLRKQTKRFIEQQPISLVINRAQRVSDGAGGFTNGTPTPLPAQTFRLIEQASSLNTETVDVSGEDDKPEFVLLGEWDADVDDDDEFQVGGIDYRVRYVRYRREYEVWAEVARA